MWYCPSESARVGLIRKLYELKVARSLRANAMLTANALNLRAGIDLLQHPNNLTP